ncbi:Holliday junction resolvase RuvX, partial [Streptomyces diastaticus]
MSGTLRRGRRLAVDVGDARIGVASCDPDGILATPVETVPGRDVPAAHRRGAPPGGGVQAHGGGVGGPPPPKGGAGPPGGEVPPL